MFGIAFLIKNAGFVYKDGRTVMLTGASVAFTHQFEISREENQLISAERLLAAITTHRADLLRPLDTEVFEVEEAA